MSQIPKILEELYLKNLDFFKHQNPKIYEIINTTKLTHSELIISEDGKLDLNYNGRTIYGGDAISYVEKEVIEFNSHFSESEGYRKSTFNATKPDDYLAPRFFHKHLNKTVHQLYKHTKNIYRNRIYGDGRFDFLVITGISLGLHISEILDKIDIQNLLILETDHELLKLSCYTTDWQDIYRKQSVSKNKSISIILLNDISEESENAALWNQLIKRAPHFPYNSVFYNHGRHDKYGQLIKKINKDITMFMNLWGFYDDEKNQLNHTLYNLNNKSKLIPSKHSFKWDRPVIICGSGPSLDSRIDQLLSIRDNCILISAGTSLGPLLNNKLIPDFHVEIESNYGVKDALKAINKPEMLKEITLICAIQCSPYILNLFKDHLAFIKDSMAVGSIILDNPKDKLLNPTPTCVNAAFALANHYKAKEILLFGTDFGFYKREDHHSKNTIYSEDNVNDNTESIKDYNKKLMDDNFIEEGYQGDCMTTGIYFTTKRRLEVAIQGAKLENQSVKILNLSDGLIIKGAHHIEKGSKITIPNKNNNFKRVFIDNSIHPNNQIYFDIINRLKDTINSLCKLLIENIKIMKHDSKSLSSTMWAISNYLEEDFKTKNKEIVYFIRGSLWHYMITGYSIIKSAPIDEHEELTKIWSRRFIDLLITLPKDLEQELYKDRSDLEKDPQLKKGLLDE